MQNAAAISTASWISVSVAPSARAARDVGVRDLPTALLNLPAIVSSAFSLGEIGAVW